MSIWCLFFGHHYMQVRILDDNPIHRYAPARCYDCGKPARRNDGQ